MVPSSEANLENEQHMGNGHGESRVYHEHICPRTSRIRRVAHPRHRRWTTDAGWEQLTRGLPSIHPWLAPRMSARPPRRSNAARVPGHACWTNRTSSLLNKGYWKWIHRVTGTHCHIMEKIFDGSSVHHTLGARIYQKTPCETFFLPVSFGSGLARLAPCRSPRSSTLF